MVLGMQFASDLVAEDKEGKYAAIIVGRGSDSMLKCLGAGKGDVPVQMRSMIATRWYEIRRLVSRLLEEEVVVSMADRAMAGAEMDVARVMAKAQVCRDLWKEPKTCVWTAELVGCCRRYLRNGRKFVRVRAA